MSLIPVTEQNFEQEVLRTELPVLVEFGAEWCGPCKVVAPELRALAQELEGKAKIVTVDVDRAPVLARELGVQSVPTFVVFHQGRPAGGRAGAMKKNELRDLLDPFLPRAAGSLRAEEVFELLRRRQVVPVDTRDAPVFGRAHLPAAVNIPFEEVPTRLAELHMLTGAPVLYCRSGDKTAELAASLAEQGVPVSYLEGGVLAWEAAGFEVERPD